MEIGGRGRGEGGNSQVGSADVEVKASEGHETERQKALKVPVVRILWSHCCRSGFNP